MMMRRLKCWLNGGLLDRLDSFLGSVANPEKINRDLLDSWILARRQELAHTALRPVEGQE